MLNSWWGTFELIPRCKMWESLPWEGRKVSLLAIYSAVAILLETSLPVLQTHLHLFLLLQMCAVRAQAGDVGSDGLCKPLTGSSQRETPDLLISVDDPALHEVILTVFIKNSKQNTSRFLSSLMFL